MARFLLTRLGQALVTLALLTVLIFVLARLTGDPTPLVLPSEATEADRAFFRQQYGLDRPVHEQYVVFLRNVLRGDFGISFRYREPAFDLVLAAIGPTLQLAGVSMLVAILLGLPLGIAAALRPGSAVDHSCRIVTTAGVSLPTFFTGLLLVYLFYYLAGIAPAPLGRLDVFASAPPHWTGFYLIDSLIAGDVETFRAALAQLILPAATLAIFSLAPLARITRASMLAALGSEFVRTARAGGLASHQIVYVYAFRNAVPPVITTLGMVFSFLLGANVLVEKVFAWPGIGSYAVEALIASDYAPVQGFVLTMALLYIALNLAIDLVYRLVDPRVRLEA